MITRPFRVEEIELGEFSGEVSGAVTVDPQWGVIERVEVQQFNFRSRRSDQRVELDAALANAARELVESVLEFDPEVANDSGLLILSAEDSKAMRCRNSASRRALAEYLAAPRSPHTSIRRAE